jgi:CheY-like chemotaxis protein
MPADVLIVEDDVPLARAISAMLRRLNINTEMVESTEEAVSLLTGQNFSVVVLDLLLREFASGYYVIDAIRRIPSADRPYVIVVTGAHMAQVANLDRAIVRAIFIKPVHLEVLATMVRAAVAAQLAAAEEAVEAKLTPKVTRVIESLRDASHTVERENDDVKKSR